MTSLSGGYLTPASRRSIFLCRPCVDRVQAAGRILSRWSGKLDVTVPGQSSFPGDGNGANGHAPATPSDGNSFGIQDLGGRFPVFSPARAFLSLFHTCFDHRVGMKIEDLFDCFV